jgi:hypothetical protein
LSAGHGGQILVSDATAGLRRSPGPDAAHKHRRHSRRAASAPPYPRVEP